MQPVTGNLDFCAICVNKICVLRDQNNLFSDSAACDKTMLSNPRAKGSEVRFEVG